MEKIKIENFAGIESMEFEFEFKSTTVVLTPIKRVKELQY